jgi:hypothetical protein
VTDREGDGAKAGAKDGSDAEQVVALARRPSAGITARTMTVALPPAEVVEVLRGLTAMAPRSLREESPIDAPRHDGKSFYERTSDGIVLWRRPKLSGERGILDPVPYPDMVEARIETTARGSRVELRWRPHPRTLRARRAWLATLVLAAGLCVVGSTFSPGTWSPQLITLAVSVAVPLAIAFHRYRRAARDRRALQPLLLRALEALAPHELGPADLEASAFRALPGPNGAAGSSRDRRR